MNLPQEIAVRSESIPPFSDGSAGRAHTRSQPRRELEEPAAACALLTDLHLPLLGDGLPERRGLWGLPPPPPPPRRQVVCPAARLPGRALRGAERARAGQSRRTRWRGREAGGGPDAALPSSPARLLTPACGSPRYCLALPFSFRWRLFTC